MKPTIRTLADIQPPPERADLASRNCEHCYFGMWAPKLVQAGATYVGGCCGTTPEHIAAIKKALDGIEEPKFQPLRRRLMLTSRSKTVTVDKDLPTVLIGERINPTGRKKLAAEIKEGSFLSVKKEAIVLTD